MVKLSKTISHYLGSTGKIKLINSVDSFILKNVYFLYAIVIISLTHLLYLSVEGDYMTVLVFILIGFITSFFSKNMVVILLIAGIFSSILHINTPIDEGFQEGAKSRRSRNRYNYKKK